MGAFISVKKDIEDETNSYFQRIYNQSPSTPTLTVDEVLELLKKFQHSTNRREREIFDCMLRNLSEEYRFFPQYPDRELHITAQLYLVESWSMASSLIWLWEWLYVTYLKLSGNHTAQRCTISESLPWIGSDID